MYLYSTTVTFQSPIPTMRNTKMSRVQKHSRIYDNDPEYVIYNVQMMKAKIKQKSN